MINEKRRLIDMPEYVEAICSRIDKVCSAEGSAIRKAIARLHRCESALKEIAKERHDWGCGVVSVTRAAKLAEEALGE